MRRQLLRLTLCMLFVIAFTAFSYAATRMEANDGENHLYINGVEVPDCDNMSASGDGWSWYAPKHDLTLTDFTGSQIYWENPEKNGRSVNINIRFSGSCYISTTDTSKDYIVSSSGYIPAIYAPAASFYGSSDSDVFYCFGYVGGEFMGVDLHLGTYVFSGIRYGFYASYLLNLTEPHLTAISYLSENGGESCAMYAQDLHIFSGESNKPYLKCVAYDSGLSGETYGLYIGDRFELTSNPSDTRSGLKEMAAITVHGGTRAFYQAPNLETQNRNCMFQVVDGVSYYPYHMEGSWNSQDFSLEYIGYGKSDSMYNLPGQQPEFIGDHLPLYFSMEAFKNKYDYNYPTLTCNSELTVDLSEFVTGGAPPYTFSEMDPPIEYTEKLYNLSEDGILTLKVQPVCGILDPTTFGVLCYKKDGTWYSAKYLKFSVSDTEGDVFNVDTSKGIYVGMARPPKLQVMTDLSNTCTYSSSSISTFVCVVKNVVDDNEDGINYNWFYRDYAGNVYTIDDMVKRGQMSSVSYDSNRTHLNVRLADTLSGGSLFCEANMKRDDLKRADGGREFCYSSDCELTSDKAVTSINYTLTDAVRASMPEHGLTAESIVIDRLKYKTLMSWKKWDEETKQWEWTHEEFVAGELYQLNAQIIANTGYYLSSKLKVSLYGEEGLKYTWSPQQASYVQTFRATEGMVHLVELTGYDSISKGDWINWNSPVKADRKGVTLYTTWYKNGNKVNNGAYVGIGDYYATVKISANGEYKIADDIVVKLNGEALPIEYHAVDNSSIRAALPTLHFVCTHEKNSNGWTYDSQQHWMVCSVCGTTLECDDHDFGDWYVDGEFNARDCSICSYTERVSNGLAGVGRVFLDMEWPYAGQTLPDISIQDTCSHYGTIISVQWYVSDTQSSDVLPSDATPVSSSTTMTFGRFYYARILFAPKSGYIFKSSTLYYPQDYSRATQLEHSGDSESGMTLLRVTPRKNVDVEVTVPEIEIGMDYSVAYYGVTTTMDGTPCDNLVSIYKDDVLDANMMTVAMMTEEERAEFLASKIFEANTEYRLVCAGAEYGVLFTTDRITVVNADSAYDTYVAGADGIFEVDAVYLMGSNVINDIDITVDVPGLCEPLSMTKHPQEGHYHIKTLAWSDNGYYFKSGDVINYDCILKLEVEIEADSGYALGNAENLNVTINGTKPDNLKCVELYPGDGGHGKFSCTYVYSIHNYGEWVIIKQATCTEDGIMRAQCQDCDEYMEKTFRLDHSFVHHDDAPSTCCTLGLREHYTCENCDTRFATNYTPIDLADLIYMSFDPDNHIYKRYSAYPMQSDPVNHWYKCPCGADHLESAEHTWNENHICTVCARGLSVSRNINNVTVGGCMEGWTLLLVEYESNGRLLGTHMVVVTDANIEYVLTIDDMESTSKLFILNDAYRPVVRMFEMLE